MVLPNETSSSPRTALWAVEEAIQVSDLPAAVKSAIRAKYPAATLRKAEKILHGSEAQYEVALSKAPKKEVLLASPAESSKRNKRLEGPCYRLDFQHFSRFIPETGGSVWTKKGQTPASAPSPGGALWPYAWIRPVVCSRAAPNGTG